MLCRLQKYIQKKKKTSHTNTHTCVNKVGMKFHNMRKEKTVYKIELTCHAIGITIAK